MGGGAPILVRHPLSNGDASSSLIFRLDPIDKTMWLPMGKHIVLSMRPNLVYLSRIRSLIISPLRYMFHCVTMDARHYAYVMQTLQITYL